MATLKLKIIPSSLEGRAGTIYYQIIHNREVRQLKTEYKVSASEWTNASGTIATANIKSERISLLSSIHEG
ncbi:MAG: site-specific integrase, partial [Bacteroidales bacterium]|nr:site-specific integrase [Bacteroidales bacterium]